MRLMCEVFSVKSVNCDINNYLIIVIFIIYLIVLHITVSFF